jgi:hypothetical protein
MNLIRVMENGGIFLVVAEFCYECVSHRNVSYNSE